MLPCPKNLLTGHLWSEGLHFCVTKKWEWTQCREVVLYRRIKKELPREVLVFSSHPKRMAYVMKAVQKLNEKLGLTKKQCVRVVESDRKNVHWLLLSRFWYVPYRLDFLTAFVRASYELKSSSIAKIVKNGKYLKDIKPAVNRFLRGNVMMNPKIATKFFNRTVTLVSELGWHECFLTKPRKSVRNILTKPKEPVHA